MSRSSLIIACLLGIIVAQFGGLPSWPGIGAKPTRATYVYEQRQNSVPSGVSSAIDKLNRENIPASQLDQNVTNGGANVPAQFAVAFAEAKKAGIPCLVVEYSRGPPKVVKAPTTEAAVLEAVK